MRLAGAGGSAAGMIAGAALLGPVRFVAGSFLGSSAAQSSVRSIVGDHGENEEIKTMESSTGGSNTVHQLLDIWGNQASESRDRDSPTPPAAPVAMNVEARMVGGVAMSEQRVVMAQAQVVDFLSSEPKTALIPWHAIGATLRDTQATVPPVTADVTAHAIPRGRPTNGNASEYARYPVIEMSTHVHKQASSTTLMSQYPVAHVMLVAAPTHNTARAQVPSARQNHGNQNHFNSAHQQRDATNARSPSLQGYSVGQATWASSAPNNSAGSQQHQGYRFGKFNLWMLLKYQRLWVTQSAF